ncbi:LysR substrate-binding domain-containing protein, partial [Nocardia neocaledoniensis]
VRSSRRVELTAAGEAFLTEARASLAAADRAVAVAAEAVGQVRGSLSVGVIPTVTAVSVPDIIAAFHASHPHVDLTVRGGGSNEFMRDLGSGRLDVAFLGVDADVAPASGLTAHEIARGRLVAVMASQHRLAHTGTLALADLVDETFIDFPAGSPGRLQGDRAFAAAGLQRRVGFEAMSTEFMLALVERGLGVCLLPVECVPANPALRAVPVADGPCRAEYVAWGSFNPSPASRAFIEQVKESIALHMVG